MSAGDSTTLRIAGLWLGPDDVWLTKRGAVPDELALERMTPQVGYYVVHAWASDPECLARVEAAFAKWGLGIANSPYTEAERIAPLLSAIGLGEVWLWERPGVAVLAPSIFPPIEPLPGKRPTPDTKRTWIEIVLVATDGSPIARERYRVVCPDGETRSGLLDENGFARIEGIAAGTCDVTFPDIDGREWSKKGSA